MALTIASVIVMVGIPIGIGVVMPYSVEWPVKSRSTVPNAIGNLNPRAVGAAPHLVVAYGIPSIPWNAARHGRKRNA